MSAIIGAQVEQQLDWLELCAAIERGHQLARAKTQDTFLRREEDTLLNRAAWIDGVGIAVKTATVFPANAALDQPTIGGSVALYSDSDGSLEALIDFHLVTKWKTAAGSLLAARRLARPDSRLILIVGAGSVAHALRDAYGRAFPDSEFLIWNRTRKRAEDMAQKDARITVIGDLEEAVGRADIVTCATMSTQPVLRGAWLRPGQHVDLIGAYRADMREADDDALKRSRLFVDARASVMDHIGELKIPIERGVIAEEDIIADFYDIEKFQRRGADEITLFKNGGGAHLDLMVSRYILDAWRGTHSQ